MHVSAEFHHYLLQILLKMGGLGVSWGQGMGLEPCKSKLAGGEKSVFHFFF